MMADRLTQCPSGSRHYEDIAGHLRGLLIRLDDQHMVDRVVNGARTRNIASDIRDARCTPPEG